MAFVSQQHLIEVSAIDAGRKVHLSVFKCFVKVLRFSRREALARFLFEIRRLFAGAAIGAV